MCKFLLFRGLAGAINGGGVKERQELVVRELENRGRKMLHQVVVGSERTG